MSILKTARGLFLLMLWASTATGEEVASTSDSPSFSTDIPQSIWSDIGAGTSELGFKETLLTIDEERTEGELVSVSVPGMEFSPAINTGSYNFPPFCPAGEFDVGGDCYSCPDGMVYDAAQSIGKPAPMCKSQDGRLADPGVDLTFGVCPSGYSYDVFADQCYGSCASGYLYLDSKCSLDAGYDTSNASCSSGYTQSLGSCLKCASGYSLTAGICQKTTYSVTVKLPWESCPSGYTSITSVDCQKVTVSTKNPSSQSACPANSVYIPGVNDCYTCPAGSSYNSNTLRCEDTYTPTKIAADALICPIGEFLDPERHLTQCFSCGSNEIQQINAGSDTCLELIEASSTGNEPGFCERGEFLDVGLQQCFVCEDPSHIRGTEPVDSPSACVGFDASSEFQTGYQFESELKLQFGVSGGIIADGGSVDIKKYESGVDVSVDYFDPATETYRISTSQRANDVVLDMETTWPGLELYFTTHTESAVYLGADVLYVDTTNFPALAQGAERLEFVDSNSNKAGRETGELGYGVDDTDIIRVRFGAEGTSLILADIDVTNFIEGKLNKVDATLISPFPGSPLCYSSKFSTTSCVGVVVADVLVKFPQVSTPVKVDFVGEFTETVHRSDGNASETFISHYVGPGERSEIGSGFTSDLSLGTKDTDIFRFNYDIDGNVGLSTGLVTGLAAKLKKGTRTLVDMEGDIFDMKLALIVGFRKDIQFEPNLEVTLNFSKEVSIDGVLVDTHSMPVGGTLDFVHPGGDLDISTIYNVNNNQLINDTDLIFDTLVDGDAFAMSMKFWPGPIPGLPRKVALHSESIGLLQQPAKILDVNFHDPIFPFASLEEVDKAEFPIGGFSEAAGSTFTVSSPVPLDSDYDGVPDVDDDLPFDPDETVDTDGDGIGDNSDPFINDADNDGVPADGSDNCPLVTNPDQTDLDGDGLGDECDADRDGDGYNNPDDLFPDDVAEWQDLDGDSLGDNADTCPLTYSENNSDTDNDGLGDVCDPTTGTQSFLNFDDLPGGSDARYESSGIRLFADSNDNGVLDSSDDFATVQSDSDAPSAPNILRPRRSRDVLLMEVYDTVTAQANYSPRLEFYVSGNRMPDMVFYDENQSELVDVVPEVILDGNHWQVAVEGRIGLVHIGGEGGSNRAEVDNLRFHPDTDNDGVANIVDVCEGYNDADSILTISPLAPTTFEATGPDGYGLVEADIPYAYEGGCGDVTVSFDREFGNFGLGGQRIVVTVEDAANQSVSEGFVFEVVDTTPPVFTLPVEDISEEASSPLGANVSFTAVIAIDDVAGEVTASCSPASGSVFSIGTTTVDCEAQDSANNSSSTSFDVTVADTTPPSVTVPATLSGIEGTPINFSADITDAVSASFTTSWDFGDGVTASGALSTHVYALYGEYTTTVTTTDEAGNTVIQTIAVTVANIAPILDLVTTSFQVEAGEVITITGNVSDPGTSALAVTATYPNGTVTVLTPSATGDIVTTHVFSLPGEYKILVQVSDGDLISSQEITVVVVDTTPPTLTAPASVTLNYGADTSPAATGSAILNDNIATAGSVSYADVVDDIFAEQTVRIITRTWSGNDAANNIAENVVQTITVVDINSPVIAVAAVVDVEFGSATSPDDIGAATATDPEEGEVAVSYVDSIDGDSISRLWQATDWVGNLASVIQIVNLVDTAAPEIQVPASTSVEVGTVTHPSNLGLATANDAVDPAPTISFSDTSVPGAGQVLLVITRTWTAVDLSGNASSGVQLIEVVDTVAPFLSVPADVDVISGEETAPGSTGTATASDAGESFPLISYSDTIAEGSGLIVRVISRTWKALDSAGNESTGTQIITVRLDDTEPVVAIVTSTLEGTAPLLVDFSATVIEGNAPLAYAWMIDDESFELETVSYSFTEPGYYTVSLEVTDLDGDIGTAEVEVNVIDITIEQLKADIEVLKLARSEERDLLNEALSGFKETIDAAKAEIQAERESFREYRDNVKSEIAALREQKKASDSLDERISLGDQISELHAAIFAERSASRSRQFAKKDEIGTLQKDKRDRRLTSRALISLINKDIVELRYEISLRRPGTNEDKQLIDAEIAELKLQDLTLRDDLRLANAERSNAVADLNAAKREISEQLQLDVGWVSIQIDEVQYVLRRIKDKAERQVLKAEIAALKAEKSDLREDASEDSSAITQEVKAIKAETAQEKADTKAARRELTEQIKLLKEMKQSI